jgi:hypothetical protein
MAGVLTDMRADLAEMSDEAPGLSATLLEQHARLLGFIRAWVLGAEDGEVAEL